MRITSDQSIAGYPAIAVRNFLRKHELTGFIAESAQASLSLSPQDANAFLNKLVDLGLLRESNLLAGLGLTDNGVRLAYASAAKPIQRITANRLLSEFMERVYAVNATPEYLFRVDGVILFGSFLSDVEQLGDVNVAVNRGLQNLYASVRSRPAPPNLLNNLGTIQTKGGRPWFPIWFPIDGKAVILPPY